MGEESFAHSEPLATRGQRLFAVLLLVCSASTAWADRTTCSGGRVVLDANGLADPSGNDVGE